MSIDQKQKEIIEEFQLFEGDKESTIFHLMEIGESLSPLEDEYKTDKYIIKGCQSKVWLIAECKDGNVNFRADSNTAITKGIISLLIRVLSGEKAKSIVDADLYFIKEIGMGNIIGTQRSNGLVAMIKQMKLFALAFHNNEPAMSDLKLRHTRSND